MQRKHIVVNVDLAVETSTITKTINLGFSPDELRVRVNFGCSGTASGLWYIESDLVEDPMCYFHEFGPGNEFVHQMKRKSVSGEYRFDIRGVSARPSTGTIVIWLEFVQYQ